MGLLVPAWLPGRLKLFLSLRITALAFEAAPAADTLWVCRASVFGNTSRSLGAGGARRHCRGTGCGRCHMLPLQRWASSGGGQSWGLDMAGLRAGAEGLFVGRWRRQWRVCQVRRGWDMLMRC
ncbi:hypothetical protein PMIN01_13603 [Paraphaeosphaeria minitans]|uniref:Secreted protein n=1 Tax=Paraphaeosphaeria minitans TaxID=565426 RepID=A0A9P6KJ67_9PLEO|nr:hypothetical protein PMIN01_13603 [Paraphaeosphaeria minitans]